MSTNNLAALSDLSNPIFEIKTDKDTHFTGALATNAKEDETISDILPAQSGLLWGMILMSDQNLDWNIWLWRNNSFDDANLDVDAISSIYRFDINNSQTHAGVGHFYYWQLGSQTGAGNEELITNPWPQPFRSDDLDLNISLQNLSVAGKNAGATGEVVVKLYFMPTGR